MKILFLDFDGVLNSIQSTLMYWMMERECIFTNEDYMDPSVARTSNI